MPSSHTSVMDISEVADEFNRQITPFCTSNDCIPHSSHFERQVTSISNPGDAALRQLTNNTNTSSMRLQSTNRSLLPGSLDSMEEDSVFDRQVSTGTVQDFMRQEGAESTEDSLSSDEQVCAICFESAAFVDVPCKCTLNYCATCWDRALTASVATRGRAQCPSCRMAFRVDYDPEVRSLVLTKEVSRAVLADWRTRLYDKAKPTQIQLLKSYGEANHGEASCAEPLCICGGTWERIDRKERIVRLLRDTEPGWRSWTQEEERRVETLALGSLVTCDLCTEPAMRSGFLWTCKKGPHTLLHPAAYDVCEECFMRYTGVQGYEDTVSVRLNAPESRKAIPLGAVSAGSVPSMSNDENPRHLSFTERARRTVQSIYMGLQSQSHAHH
jgi:hypothetical protein